MTPKYLFLLGTALCGLFSAVNPVIAQGTAFTSQSFLTDNGAPANGLFDLTFTVYNAASGGAAVGTSNVVNDLPISNGLFTVTLDFGAAPFDGIDRWLEIGVRPGASTGAFTTLAPRQFIKERVSALVRPNDRVHDGLPLNEVAADGR